MKQIQVSIRLRLTAENKYEGIAVIVGEGSHNKVYNFITGDLYDSDNDNNKILMYNKYEAFFIPNVSTIELQRNLSYHEFNVAMAVRYPICEALDCIKNNFSNNSQLTNIGFAKVEKEFPPQKIYNNDYSHIYSE